jgi:hypothetical protein
VDRRKALWPHNIWVSARIYQQELDDISLIPAVAGTGKRCIARGIALVDVSITLA